MFDMKSPCSNCPFRRGQGELFRMTRTRLDEIRRAYSFQCHKTLNHSNPRVAPQQCAGLMAIHRLEGTESPIMQIGERLGALDPDALDPRGEAYRSWEECLQAHGAHQ